MSEDHTREYINIIRSHFLFSCFLILSACSKPVSVSEAQIATQFRNALNNKDITTLVRLLGTPLTAVEQQWETAKDGVGFVLASRQLKQIESAEKLKELSDKVKDKYVIFMRAYFEKPRTTIGWKGLIYDPDMDGSDNIEKGIEIARKLLLKINEIGLPVATEFLDPIVPQYIGDLVSWVAIGARTTESQIHRQMASGLSMPVGFKNGTSGDLDIAINAISSTANPHSFLGVNLDGSISKVNTRGNKYGHIVLRGGINGPNYSSEDISKTQEKLRNKNIK